MDERIDDLVERIAFRVVELLDQRDERATMTGRLVDAQAIADLLGLSRETVYDHAAEMGGRKIGSGHRWRFDTDVARAWSARQEADESAPRPAPRAKPVKREGLLPVKAGAR